MEHGLIKVTFSITGELGKELHCDCLIPIKLVLSIHDDQPLARILGEPASKFWDSCVLMGFIVKD